MRPFAAHIAQAYDPEKTIHVLLDKAIKPIRDDKQFVVETIPYTPPTLIEEIFSKIPPIADRILDTKIAVIYTVEMAIYLCGLGFENVTLITREHDERMANGAEKFGYQYMTEEEIKKMKFDVVVGNPPYGGGPNKNIFHTFYQLAIQLATSHVAFVAPITWLSSRKKILKELRTAMFDAGLIYVKELDAQKTFGVVVDHLGYTIQDRSISSTESRFDRLVGDTITLHKGHTAIADPVSMSILTKIKSGEEKLNTQKSGHYSVSDKGTCWNESCSFHCSTEHPHLMINKIDNGNLKYAYVNKQKKMEHAHKPRVVFGFLTSKTTLGTIVTITDPVELSYMCVYVPVENITEAKSLESFLHSKMFRFVLPMLRPNTTNTVGAFRDVSIPPLTKKWTDEELYNHFNLTQEEIDLIESTIK